MTQRLGLVKPVFDNRSFFLLLYVYFICVIL
jgi:hypothetical protein